MLLITEFWLISLTMVLCQLYMYLCSSSFYILVCLVLRGQPRGTKSPKQPKQRQNDCSKIQACISNSWFWNRLVWWKVEIHPVLSYDLLAWWRAQRNFQEDLKPAAKVTLKAWFTYIPEFREVLYWLEGNHYDNPSH